MVVSRECMFLGSLSRHNEDLEWRTLKPPPRVTALRSSIYCVIALRSWMDHVIALRQISVTALFYLEDSRKIHLRGMRARRSKDEKRRVPQRAVWGWGWEGAGWGEGAGEPFGSSFYMFFSSPWACRMQIGLSQECCSTWSPHSGPRTFLWPSSVLFSRAFPFLVF